MFPWHEFPFGIPYLRQSQQRDVVLQASTLLRTCIISIPLRPDTFERLLRAGILLVLDTALGLNQAHQVVELTFPLMS